MPKFDHIITIKPPVQKKARRRTLVEPTRFDEELIRRVQGQNYIYLRIWDLAQYADGSDRDDLTIYGSAADVDPPRNPTFNASLFSVDYETWDTEFKEITEDLSDYTVTIDHFAGGFVSGRGIRSTLPILDSAPTPIIRAQNRFFNTWVPPFSTNFKITALPSYSAPAVSFICDEDCDLFLAPAMLSRMATAYYEGNVVDDTDDTLYRMYAVQAPLPRSTAGDAAWDTIWANKGNPNTMNVIDVGAYRNTLLSDRSPTLFITNNGVTTTTDAINFPTDSDHPTAEWGVRPRLRMEPMIRGPFPSFGVEGHCYGAIRKNTSPAEWYFIFAKQQISGLNPTALGGNGFWYYGFGGDPTNWPIV